MTLLSDVLVAIVQRGPATSPIAQDDALIPVAVCARANDDCA